MRTVLFGFLLIFMFVAGASYKADTTHTPPIKEEIAWEYEVEEEEVITKQESHIVYSVTSMIEKLFHSFTEKFVQLLYNFASLFFT